MAPDDVSDPEADPDDDVIDGDEFDDLDEGRCPDCGARFEDEHALDCTYMDDEEDVEDFA